MMAGFVFFVLGLIAVFAHGNNQQQYTVCPVGSCQVQGQLSVPSAGSPLVYSCQNTQFGGLITVPHGCNTGNGLILNGQTYEQRDGNTHYSFRFRCSVSAQRIDYQVEACGFLNNNAVSWINVGGNCQIGSSFCRCYSYVNGGQIMYKAECTPGLFTNVGK